MTLHHIDKISNSPLLKLGPWFQRRIQEREPITRVWGGAPSGDQGQSPGSGASLVINIRSSEDGNFLSIFIQDTNQIMAEVIVLG